MRLRILVAALTLAVSAQPAIIDRIAIVVGNSIIKDSDIVRDIRLTDFLNGDPLSFSPDARKAAASRLIDQLFIRREIRIGDYPTATVQQAQQRITALTHDKYKTDSSLDSALRQYGLTRADLQVHLQWQLSVLQFIDARFKPAAYVPEDQIEAYLKEHGAELRTKHPAATPAALRTDAENLLSGQKQNQIFFEWLDGQRKSTKLIYLEGSLK